MSTNMGEDDRNVKRDANKDTKRVNENRATRRKKRKLREMQGSSPNEQQSPILQAEVAPAPTPIQQEPISDKTDRKSIDQFTQHALSLPLNELKEAKAGLRQNGTSSEREIALKNAVYDKIIEFKEHVFLAEGEKTIMPQAPDPLRRHFSVELTDPVTDSPTKISIFIPEEQFQAHKAAASKQPRFAARYYMQKKIEPRIKESQAIIDFEAEHFQGLLEKNEAQKQNLQDLIKLYQENANNLENQSEIKQSLTNSFNLLQSINESMNKCINRYRSQVFSTEVAYTITDYYTHNEFLGNGMQSENKKYNDLLVKGHDNRSGLYKLEKNYSSHFVETLKIKQEIQQLIEPTNTLRNPRKTLESVQDKKLSEQEIRQKPIENQQSISRQKQLITKGFESLDINTLKKTFVLKNLSCDVKRNKQDKTIQFIGIKTDDVIEAARIAQSMTNEKPPFTMELNVSDKTTAMMHLEKAFANDLNISKCIFKTANGQPIEIPSKEIQVAKDRISKMQPQNSNNSDSDKPDRKRPRL